MPRVYSRIRPIVFCLDPETAHNITINILALGEKLPLVWRCLTHMFAFRDPRLEIETMGLRFCNPVGVAAGYDKNAQATRGLAALGAGHVEVGTITPLRQIGAQRPRLFRLPKQNAMINRLGFPNAGAATIAPRLASLRSVSMNWRQAYMVHFTIQKVSFMYDCFIELQTMRSLNHNRYSCETAVVTNCCSALEQMHENFGIKVIFPMVRGSWQLQGK